ncbi:hypothetical protein CV770_39120 [Bradyrhizobium sp. AC87j1]|nr:hypothetical protein CV770_39120 [Bradyrhizobium sp. AC87j1]
MKWTYETGSGLAEIISVPGGCALLFDGQVLGQYISPVVAAGELANGMCHWPWAGDPTKMGIPEDLSEWQCVP